MVEHIDPATRALVSMALDAANARQLAHAGNIAMAQSLGYQPVSVAFEEHLADAREAIQQGRLQKSDLLGHEATMVTAPESAAQSVQLDQEVAAMSHNALHYQALVKLLSRHYATLALAADGGRR